jgi:hypothetical protein
MSQNPLVPSINCCQPELHFGMQGVARVAVDDAHSQLQVTFLRPINLPQESYLFDPGSYTLTGGQRFFPRILSAEPYPLSSPPGPHASSVLLTLSGPGDFSIYTLTVSGPDIDPFFSSRRLRFRLACEDRFDCRPSAAPSSQPPELDVTIDYLAKDYSSFRQALLDFIPTRLAAWTERSEADIGIMLLELFAATADNLSYMQDRVANEAFLGTATQRRSVAGHLALLGYQMDEGASAYTWLQFQVNDLCSLAAGFKVSNQPGSSDEPIIVFETMDPATLRPEHNQMLLYTWGNEDCCLPASALSAVLVGRYEFLRAGDYLLVEDDSGHRDIVRLSSPPEIVSANDSGLSGFQSSPAPAPLTIVRWSLTTPLNFDYCLADTASSPPRPRTWVRGNLVFATHGETFDEALRDLTDDEKRQLQAEIAARPPGSRVPRQRLPLSMAPLAHLDVSTLALSATGVPTGIQSTPDNLTAVLTRTRNCVSTLQITVDGTTGTWQEEETLLNSGPEDQVFRVEIDDQGQGTVVFGDGVFGLRPDETTTVTASYRVGGGRMGNLAAGTLVRQIVPNPLIDSVTNPLAARGGRDLESRQHARRFGPATAQNPLVAVTTADYQTAAENFVDSNNQNVIQRANALFRWTGSWLTVTLGVEPLGTSGLTADLKQALTDYLATRRLAGYDLEILPAVYVPLEIVIEFCVAPGFRSGDVQQNLLQALSNSTLANGSQGFFSPDLFSFGDSLYVSRLYAAIMAVPGVLSAHIATLARLHSPQPDVETAANLQQGFLSVGADQIIRLDNDPNFPQNGTLSIQPVGN